MTTRLDRPGSDHCSPRGIQPPTLPPEKLPRRLKCPNVRCDHGQIVNHETGKLLDCFACGGTGWVENRSGEVGED